MRMALLPAVLWGVATLMVAGIVHIASILILPHVAPDTAYARLGAIARLNAVSLLPKPAASQDPLPFRDPTLATAVCRYDLAGGGLRVGIAIGDASIVAMSFHSAKGVPFYALTDRSQNEGRIDLWLVTPEQLEKLEAADGEDDPVHDVRVTAPDPQGFVEFDVLPRVGGSKAAAQVLSSASCRLEPTP